MAKYRCKICGEVFEVQEGETPVCPRCRQKGDKLEMIETSPAAETKSNLRRT